tara:strand:- start:1902 stop:2570 length:669 start_codon:yes stop_codon:yes gene_type:complete
MAAVAAISAGVSAIGGAVSANQAKQQAKGARNAARRAKAEMDRIKSERRPITNPYEGFTDLSNTVSNPFASLGVATQAAEIQMEQADIALANSLDTIRATGAGAGGATALAQAALQSKKGVAASIEQQEVANEKLRADGESKLQQIKMAEAQRMQQAGAAGEQWMFQQEEARTNADLGHAAGQMAQHQQTAANAQAAQGAAWGGAFSGMASGIMGSLDPTKI